MADQEFLGWWCKYRVNMGGLMLPQNTFHEDPVEMCPGPHVPCWSQSTLLDTVRTYLAALDEVQAGPAYDVVAAESLEHAETALRRAVDDA